MIMMTVMLMTWIIIWQYDDDDDDDDNDDDDDDDGDDDDLDHHAVVAESTIIRSRVSPRRKLYWLISVPGVNHWKSIGVPGDQHSHIL